MELPKLDFDINKDSTLLKQMVAQFDSDSFLTDIAFVLTLIDSPRIQCYPFQGLDSPFRQLTYLASLNLNSASDDIIYNTVPTNEQWYDIVVQMLRVRAGYYDELLPQEGQESEDFAKSYSIAMPVFNSYFDMGNLNYEEQEIERVTSYFAPFNEEIENHFNLNTEDFINIYNLVDHLMEENLNRPLKIIRDDPESLSFWNKMKEEQINPMDWNYIGGNRKLQELVSFMKNRGEVHTINKEQLYKYYDHNKIDSFLSNLTICRTNDTSYLFYTQPNKVLLKPIFIRTDGRLLVIDTKQIIHATYRLLLNFIIGTPLKDSFYRKRGKILQQKVCQILNDFFKGEAFIYNEYSIEKDSQDVLMLYKGLVFVIETKATKEFSFSGVPDTINVYKQYFHSFQRGIQKGYDQCWRVKQRFLNHENFTIVQKNPPVNYIVKGKKYSSVFPIIITLEKFQEPQINTTSLLKINHNDNYFPLSMSIDDFEVLFLALKKQRITIMELIKFFKIREQLQGRIVSNDELRLWGVLLLKKDFKVPDDKHQHFQTFPEMTVIFDELYKTGLGFKNEKNLERKKAKSIKYFEPRHFSTES